MSRRPRARVGALAVLAEPADRGWRATLDGKPLARRTAYGWAQAFVLPATSGRLRIRFDGTSPALVAVGELVAVVVVVRAWRSRLAGPTTTRTV